MALIEGTRDWSIEEALAAIHRAMQDVENEYALFKLQRIWKYLNSRRREIINQGIDPPRIDWRDSL